MSASAIRNAISHHSLFATLVATVLCLSAVSSAARGSVVVRVMASNLTSGSNQRYEGPGLDILQGLKPDVVAMQEFNYSDNSTSAIRQMIDTTFGTNFVYFRESGYSIPNGIISRYPIVTNGSWDSTDLPDRGYAWAQIHLPGTNDLYIVSVHLKASSGSSNEARRSAEANEVTGLIQSNFPANAWIIVAGDMNLYSDTEPAIMTFKTYLSDSPVPADQNGNQNTNLGRSERYDRVLPSFSMTNALTPVVLPSRTSTNGLVFDSRVYTPLSDVPPVLQTDSGTNGMQHMGVVKDFLITSDVPPGALAVDPTTAVGSAGDQGGPFSPAAQNYALTNTGGTALSWTASVSNNWLDLSATSGSLDAGTATTVTVTTNAATAALVGGLYTNRVSFMNVTNGGGNTNVIWAILVRDGISDAWRQQYFGHVEPEASDQSRAQDDPDGDGFNNLQEQTAGTDPTNSHSALRITSIALQGVNVLVTWSMGPGRTNALQMTNSNPGGSYDTNGFADIVIVTNTVGSTTNAVDAGGTTGAPSRYYRVRIVP
jgi:endonuclease/exonuclease/phosphatase family metal-dependent hydrolase